VVTSPYIVLVFFVYGLAFFCMGLAVALEAGRGPEARLRHAIRPLAGFGLIHGTHEWLEMFLGLGLLPFQNVAGMAWDGLRLSLLAFSFLSLSAFGASLLSPNDRIRRVSMLVPLALAAVWGFGVFALRGRFPFRQDLWDAAEVWTRYALAIPSGLLASAGLVAQQRAFRREGMAQFGQDSLWAAIAFAWYGVIGQVFTRHSLLSPSNLVNQDLFLQTFGFPVQLLRAVTAVVAAVFVIRFLRSFEVETQREIADLQAARLREAERRETLRGELLRRVVAAQEAERTRIARELHDETGQALTAVGMGLRGIAAMLRQDAEKAAQNLRQLEGLVTRSLDELQRLIGDLRPSHLDDLGLPAALRWYAGEVQHRGSLGVRVQVLGEPAPLSPAVSTALFRVAQEALGNVVKHAGAKTASLRLAYGAQAVSLQVEDDGRGFDTSVMGSTDRSSWGLVGIEERTALLGGRLTLRSRPGEGTLVEVTIPYAPRVEERDDDTAAPGR
jgi:signal transduction histidine kinase